MNRVTDKPTTSDSRDVSLWRGLGRSIGDLGRGVLQQVWLLLMSIALPAVDAFQDHVIPAMPWWKDYQGVEIPGRAKVAVFSTALLAGVVWTYHRLRVTSNASIQQLKEQLERDEPLEWRQFRSAIDGVISDLRGINIPIPLTTAVMRQQVQDALCVNQRRAIAILRRHQQAGIVSGDLPLSIIQSEDNDLFVWKGLCEYVANGCPGEVVAYKEIGVLVADEQGVERLLHAKEKYPLLRDQSASLLQTIARRYVVPPPKQSV